MDSTEKKMCVPRSVWLEVDSKRFCQNIVTIKQHLAPKVKFCAVIKANAYGHGAVELARICEEMGVDYFAVATVSEGVELRSSGIVTSVLVLGAIFEKEARFAVQYDLTQAVFSHDMLDTLDRVAKEEKKLAKVHLAIDTGMGRIGIEPHLAGDFATYASKKKNIFLEGIFSHFAAADSKEQSFAREQLQRFEDALQSVEASGIKIPLRHIANSAAIFTMPETHFDMVRAGIVLYGYPPSKEIETEGISPCLKLRAKITALRTIKEGMSVGYGREFVAEKDTRVATLPLGYADGYFRHYARGAFLVHEKTGTKLFPLGRICMDQLMVEVPPHVKAEIGDVVTVLGDLPSADDLAEVGDTISYEVLTSLAKRIPRMYV